jgi:hypothetical protein
VVGDLPGAHLALFAKRPRHRRAARGFPYPPTSRRPPRSSSGTTGRSSTTAIARARGRSSTSQMPARRPRPTASRTRSTSPTSSARGCRRPRPTSPRCHSSPTWSGGGPSRASARPPSTRSWSDAVLWSSVRVRPAPPTDACRPPPRGRQGWEVGRMLGVLHLLTAEAGHRLAQSRGPAGGTRNVTVARHRRG